MRQDRFIAVGAILNLHGLDVVVTSPLALAGMGRSSLGYSHRSSPCSEALEIEKVKLDSRGVPVKLIGSLQPKRRCRWKSFLR
jgi:hypothetical protein